VILNKKKQENEMSNIKIARKKPVDIKVIQITGTDENIEEIRDFFGRGALSLNISLSKQSSQSSKYLSCGHVLTSSKSTSLISFSNFN
jgi:hypothetical protein